MMEILEGIPTSKPHPEMEYRSALGVIRLERKYSAERLEAASTRAVRLNFLGADEKIATGLHREGVSLEHISRAILLGRAN